MFTGRSSPVKRLNRWYRPSLIFSNQFQLGLIQALENVSTSVLLARWFGSTSYFLEVSKYLVLGIGTCTIGMLCKSLVLIAVRHWSRTVTPYCWDILPSTENQSFSFRSLRFSTLINHHSHMKFRLITRTTPLMIHFNLPETRIYEHERRHYPVS